MTSSADITSRASMLARSVPTATAVEPLVVVSPTINSGAKSPTRSSWAASRSSAGAELFSRHGVHVVAEVQVQCHQVNAGALRLATG